MTDERPKIQRQHPGGIVRKGVNDGLNINPLNPTFVMPKAPPPPPPPPKDD